MKQEGQLSKKNKTNLLQYAIQLVCILKWNKRDSFQKKKYTNLLQYAIQLVCILKWNKRDSFQKKQKHNLLQYAIQQEGQFSKNTQFITVCYSTCVRIEMKQEGQFSKKQQKHQFITVCYSTRGAVFKKQFYYCMIFNLCAYWNETRGIVFKKKKYTNLLQYAIQPMCILKSNKIFKKIQLMKYATELVCGMKQEGQFSITVCYSTCVRIEMKQEGQF